MNLCFSIGLKGYNTCKPERAIKKEERPIKEGTRSECSRSEGLGTFHSEWRGDCK